MNSIARRPRDRRAPRIWAARFRLRSVRRRRTRRDPTTGTRRRVVTARRGPWHAVRPSVGAWRGQRGQSHGRVGRAAGARRSAAPRRSWLVRRPAPGRRHRCRRSPRKLICAARFGVLPGSARLGRWSPSYGEDTAALVRRLRAAARLRGRHRARCRSTSAAAARRRRRRDGRDLRAGAGRRRSSTWSTAGRRGLRPARYAVAASGPATSTSSTGSTTPTRRRCAGLPAPAVSTRTTGSRSRSGSARTARCDVRGQLPPRLRRRRGAGHLALGRRVHAPLGLERDRERVGVAGGSHAGSAAATRCAPASLRRLERRRRRPAPRGRWTPNARRRDLVPIEPWRRELRGAALRDHPAVVKRVYADPEYAGTD